MSVRDAWREAFPAVAARVVLAYVVDCWRQVSRQQSPHFAWALNEPAITKRFRKHLAVGSDNAGLTGHWSAEAVDMDLQSDLSPKDTHRTDIMYFSDRVQPRLSLTFEFKKLKDNSDSRKKYYGNAGMCRFVEAIYAKDDPFGIMVAIIEDDSQRACVKHLKSALRSDDARALLKYVPDPATGLHVREPSCEMPKLAEFDTQHHRDSGPFDTFMFCHLVLGFPDSP